MSYLDFETAQPEHAVPLSMPADLSGSTHASETFNGIGRVQSQFGNAAVSRGVLRALKSGGIQAKLTVGAPGDPYEQEVDRVAEQIMSRTSGPAVQRKCTACAASAPCEKCRHSAPKIQTKRDSREPIDLAPQTSEGISALGGGQPLPAPVRERFEPQFAQDFSGVRVHTGGSAAALAGEIGARAFTYQNNIVFGQGQYGPENSDGQRLLAHELTHVVQQGGSNGPDRVQADWLDDVKETASEALEAGSAGISEAYEAAKDAVTTVATSASEAISGVANIVDENAEKTRANLISQVSATRQKVMGADPAIVATPERAAALNNSVSQLNIAVAGAVTVPFAPVLVPIGEVIGEILLAIGAAIAALSLGEILLIVALILAILALIYVIFFRDTRKFPETDTDTEPKDKTKDKDQPKKEPETDRPPPPFPLPQPDCLPGPTPRGSFRVTDKRHPYFKPGTVEVKDNRNKHTRNIIPTFPGTPCTAAFLLAVVNQNPANFGPFLQRWIAAAKSGNRDYGSQMGSDTIGNYVEKVEEIVLDKSNQIDRETWKGDTGETCGVDIGTPGAPELTSMARIAEAPHSAHIIPEK